MSHVVPLPLLPLCGALVLGRLTPEVYALPLTLGAVVVAFWAHRGGRGRFAAAVSIALGAGAVWPRAEPAAVPSFPAQILARVEAVESLSPDERQAVELRVRAVRGDPSSPWRVFPVVVHSSLEPQPVLAVGAVIEVRGTFRRAEPRANPSDRFAPRARFVARSAHAVHASPPAWQRELADARRAAYLRLERLAEPGRSVAQALFLGARREMPDALRQRWAAAGLAHLLAISGLHVTLVGGAVFLGAAAVARGVAGLGVTPRGWRRWASLAAFCAAALYCGWAGAPTSAVRAVAMAGALAGATWVGERMAGIQALALAATGIVLYDHRALSDVGLWLSVAAVASLLAPQAGRWGARALEALIAPAIATAPLVAGTFGSVAWASPLANAVALPLATFALTPLALMHGAASGLGIEQLATPLTWTAALLDGIASWAAHAEGVSAGWSAGEILLASVAATVSSWVGVRGRWATRIVVLLVLALPARSSEHGLSMTHLAVGQGDATLLRFPDGAAWLIDAGGRVGPGRFDPGAAFVVPALLDAGVTSLEGVVATHGDADHVRGLHAVLDRFEVRRLLWNGTSRAVMRAVVAHARRRGVHIEQVEQPRVFSHGAATLRVSPAGGTTNENDASLISIVALKTFRAIFAGDISEERESYIEWPRASVLVAPHHGSRTSTSQVLLDRVQPKLVVISVGAFNRYRMPHPEVIGRLQRAAIEFRRTDRDGQVRIRTRGEGFSVSTRGGWLWCDVATGCDPRPESPRL